MTIFEVHFENINIEKNVRIKGNTLVLVKFFFEKVTYKMMHKSVEKKKTHLHIVKIMYKLFFVQF